MEYICLRYGRVCCRLCGFVKFNSFFVCFVKNDFLILKVRFWIDLVMVKVVDLNSFIDLRKDFLYIVDELV